MRLSISCHYVLCKSGFRVIFLFGGPLSRSYKLSHNLLFNPKVPPWLPEGNGKILHEWTHQRQDHSMSRINSSHCKTSAHQQILQVGSTDWKPMAQNLIYSQHNKSLSWSQFSHLRFQRKILRTQTKTWECEFCTSKGAWRLHICAMLLSSLACGP